MSARLFETVEFVIVTAPEPPKQLALMPPPSETARFFVTVTPRRTSGAPDWRCRPPPHAADLLPVTVLEMSVSFAYDRIPPP